MGYDPDHARSLGEVGREGVSVASLDDMERLFGDIPLDKVTTSMTINAPAVVLLAFYVALAEQQGVPPEKLRGTHAERHAQGVHRAEGVDLRRPRPHAHHPRHAGVRARARCRGGTRSRQRLPHPRSRGDGGAGAGVHARRRHRLRAAGPSRPASTSTSSRRGCRSSGTSTTTSSRRSPSSAPAAACGRGSCASASAPRTRASWLLRTHAQTAGVSLMAQQPLNNVVRTTMQALAAVLGGTQSLHTNSYDETYALPTEEAATLALRTQQIIAEEIGVAAVADPLGGSYFVESADRSHGSRGRRSTSTRSTRWAASCAPSRRAIRSARSPRRPTTSSARSTAASGRSSASTSTSVDEAATIPTLKIDMAPEREQVERVREVRARRDDARAREGRRNRAARVRRRRQCHGRCARSSPARRDSGGDLSRVSRRIRRIPRPGRDLGRAKELRTRTQEHHTRWRHQA